MNLELRDLCYFAAVAEHGNLRRAAEALDLSQPALSKSLRRLEHTVQGKLVKRTPKGVELTPIGSALLAHVRRLRLSLDDAGNEIADLCQGRAGLLRVGARTEMTDDLMPLACAELFRTAPGVTLNVLVADNNVLMPALRSGELDLAVSGIPASPYEDLVQEHLYEDQFAVIASASHRLAGRKAVTMADIARERWALAPANVLSGRWLRHRFEELGLPSLQTAFEANAMPLRM